MRIVFPFVVLGVAFMLGFSGTALRAQEQPAAGAPPPATTNPAQPTTQAQPANQAQPTSNAAPTEQVPPPPARPRRAYNPRRQARRLARELGLTPEQQSEIEPILAQRHQNIQSVRADSTLTPKDRRLKLRGIARKSDRKISAILSDAQKRQYKQWKQERRANRQMRREQQGGPPPPA